MHVTRLDIRGLRRFEAVSLAPDSGLNLITGDNGAGKTSLLEALHLMAYGRSFRGRVRDGLVRTGSEAVEVFVEWQEGGKQKEQTVGAASSHEAFPVIPAGFQQPNGWSSRTHPATTRRAGLRHSGQEWQGRLDGETVGQLGELCAALAVVSFEPGSHALVAGGGEPRRRFVDWGLFHVEQAEAGSGSGDFMLLWRRYSRALKQRNALLKSGAPSAQLDVWDHELAEAGESLTQRRQLYLEALRDRLAGIASELAPSLGRADLEFQPGWRRHELSLADALLLARDRDRATGFTSAGPHRADWRVGYASRIQDEPLSRGQAKLTALACLLAQAEDFAARRGEWPVIALDDLASELDRSHQRRVLDHLQACGAQVFITGTEIPSVLADRLQDVARFHVERDQVLVLT